VGRGEVSDLWVVGDLRTLLFAGRQGLANSTFSHVGGLPDLFMEHDVGGIGPARQTVYGQRNHLINVASKFREITTKAIDVYYNRDECFEIDDIFRLAILVVEQSLML
jgi:hypothetical protein